MRCTEWRGQSGDRGQCRGAAGKVSVGHEVPRLTIQRAAEKHTALGDTMLRDKPLGGATFPHAEELQYVTIRRLL